MYPSSDSFGKQVGDLSNTYTNYCGASCLFFWGDGSSHGLRIEAEFIAKEFVDNVEFGHDPEGLLFYDSVSDFNVQGTTTYKVYCNTEKPPAIRVDFFSPDDSTVRFCSFVTRDTNGIDSTLLAKYISDGSGTWTDNQLATSFAKLYKQTKGHTTKLTLAPIGKQIVWDINDATKNLDIQGNFSFYKMAQITSGTTCGANYDEDRIIFYNTSTKQPLGMFFPSSPIPFDNHTDVTLPTATFHDI